ncbi:ribonuclease H2, subunit C [Phanerochaete sordida]|uniref:Ribonuclease H2, subunit C n=1 Tax=Phanerochaete sordida TaxID=48140 RepID=A0A9P3GR22_9APHY|nr:ribonuclease H2, subunit C [Phanerochaete sordida]
MPFHIQYSGPAPVSTYFRVKPSPDPAQMPGSSGDTSQNSTPPAVETIETIDSQETLVADTPSLAPTPSTPSVATLSGDVDMLQSTSAATPSGKHFVASFRGRTVRGTEVALPPGFAGVVLATPEAAEKKAVPEKRSDESPRKTRPRRAATKKQAMQMDEEVAGAEVGMEGVEEIAPARTLQATATFSSFTLWHPDIPVDEGRDEYLRSLSEWTAIAAEIHHHEE